MVKTKKNWKLLSDKKFHISDDPAVLEKIILENRGFKSSEEAQQFLHPDLKMITYESVGIEEKNVKTALKRLKLAQKNDEQIVVFGDYDVDGITGSAILWETLSRAGYRVMPYIPHRTDEGYGLSQKGIDNAILLYPNTKLIITVDNGIVAHEAVLYAKEKGIDVIITDHHLSEDKKELPAAISIIHTTALCGAGVAWLFAKEFKNDETKDDHIELAALGTIADLVPLLKENRAIVYFGLEALSRTKRVGLKSLFTLSGLDGKKITTYDVGHIIAPRLNASGRLEHAMDSLRLLCTTDPRRARELAEKLQTINLERQKIMFEGTLHASTYFREISDLKKVLIVSHSTYSEGVIGLIAGKLVEEYYRPAIVISEGEKMSKGSVRSVAGFNIISFLREHKDFFINVGGHPMAAGFSIETARIKDFKKKLEDESELKVEDNVLKRSLIIDCEIELSSINQNVYSSIQKFSPFGMKNHEPIFLSKKVILREFRPLGKEGKHVRFIIQQDDGMNVYEGVGFGLGERIQELEKDSYLDVVFSIDENTWNGNTKLQLKIKDFA